MGVTRYTRSQTYTPRYSARAHVGIAASISFAIAWAPTVDLVSVRWFFFGAAILSLAYSVLCWVQLRRDGRGTIPASDVKVSVGQENQLCPTFRVVIENRRQTAIVVQDVRLMIAEPFGVPFKEGRHLNRPISPGHTEQFTFTAEQVSKFLKILYHPQESITVQSTMRKLTPRCVLGSNESFFGDPISVSTDSTIYKATISRI